MPVIATQVKDKTQPALFTINKGRFRMKGTKKNDPDTSHLYHTWRAHKDRFSSSSGFHSTGDHSRRSMPEPRQLVNYAVWHIFCWPNSDVLLRTNALYFSDLHVCALFMARFVNLLPDGKLQGFRKSLCPCLNKYNAIIAIDWSQKSEKNQLVIVEERNESAWFIVFLEMQVLSWNFTINQTGNSVQTWALLYFVCSWKKASAPCVSFTKRRQMEKSRLTQSACTWLPRGQYLSQAAIV